MYNSETVCQRKDMFEGVAQSSVAPRSVRPTLDGLPGKRAGIFRVDHSSRRQRQAERIRTRGAIRAPGIELADVFLLPGLSRVRRRLETYTASILAGRDFAAELVEEIKDEADFVDRRGLASGGSLQHGKALAIRVYVKV